MKDYLAALDCFITIKDLPRAIEAAEATKDWENVLGIIYKFKDDISQEDYQNYVDIYMPKALNELVEKIDDSKLDPLLEEKFN